MAKVFDFWEMWQCSPNLRTTQKESCAQNKQTAAVGYISDTEESVTASWSNYQHDCAAAFKSSERSPLSPAFSAMELTGGQTQVLNVHRIQRIKRLPAVSDDVSAPESMSDTEHWPKWNGDLDNSNDSEDHYEADNRSDGELDNCIEDPESHEHSAVCPTPNVPGLIWPTRRAKEKSEKGLVMVNATETRRIRGNRKK